MHPINQAANAARLAQSLLSCLLTLVLFAATAGAGEAPSRVDEPSADKQAPEVPAGYRLLKIGSGGLTGYSGFNGSDQFAASFEDNTGTSRGFFYDGKSIKAIGTLGGTHTYVGGLNKKGEVAGHSYIAGNARFHAFLWSEKRGMRDLGSVARDGSSTAGHVTPLNDRAQVVRESTAPGGEAQAFVWSSANGMRSLGGLPDYPAGFSIAHAINDSGLVAGHGVAMNGDTRAFVWSQRRGMIDLGTLGGSVSVAAGLSDDGTVVGNSTTAGGMNHMYVWTANGGMRDLGTAGGVESYTSEKPMSANGNVAGLIRLEDGTDHAALWTRATGLLDLGTLGGPISSAAGVNNYAQVVGAADISLAERNGFIWTVKTGMIDLNDRLCQRPPGLSLGTGLAISNNGVIFASSNAGYYILIPGCEH